MAEIHSTNGHKILIDDEDMELASRYKWGVYKDYRTFRPQTSVILDGKRITLRLHRLVMNAKPGQQVDHANGDGLDNRKSNLRFATGSQIKANSRRYNSNTSGYKGVYWHKAAPGKGRSKWKALIRVRRQLICLGYFKNKKEAARAYDAAALKYFGQFASLNFPP